MLKNLLEGYNKIAMMHTERDDNNRAIYVQEVACSGVRRTLDGKYINIGGNKIDSNSKIMLRNNPDAVQVNKRSDKEEEIILNYDDKKVRLVGFKKL